MISLSGKEGKNDETISRYGNSAMRQLSSSSRAFRNVLIIRQMGAHVNVVNLFNAHQLPLFQCP